VVSLYVAPERWGHGYGRALLAAGREALVELGYEPLWLWVLEGNDRAQALYESDGWVLDGARERSVINGVDFGVDERKMRWTG
jgi:GNAT superfamily N-acetyltransferase